MQLFGINRIEESILSSTEADWHLLMTNPTYTVLIVEDFSIGRELFWRLESELGKGTTFYFTWKR
jgi:aspartate carbamoyltransferase regulatory subunit